MMMSPESYYEFYIKGKSQEEISKEIKSLKRELRQLIKKTEQNLFMPEELTHPNSQVRIKYNREYLDLAITAYEQAGGTYKRSKSELNSLKFDQDLNSMNKLIFTIGGFFGGYETRTFSISGDNVMLEIAHSLTGTLLKPPAKCPFTKNSFIQELKKIHIGEWRKEYCDPNVMDGTQWNLEIHFNGKKKTAIISGCNAYPYNFDDLTNLLGIDDEQEEGEEEIDENTEKS